MTSYLKRVSDETSLNCIQFILEVSTALNEMFTTQVEQFKACQVKLLREALCIQILLKYLAPAVPTSIVTCVQTADDKLEKLQNYDVCRGNFVN